MMSDMGMKTRIKAAFDAAVEQVTAALKTEGFGVVSDIDMQATFKNKLNVDFRPYRILGACAPQLAYDAVNAYDDVSLLLPCNVTVSQVDDETVQVAIVDPQPMLGLTGSEALNPVALEARERLARVMDHLNSTS